MKINTKNFVLVLVACIVIMKSSGIVLLGVVGGAISSVLSKYLKVMFASLRVSSEFSRRPPTDVQPEPGMPSSHAMNLFFLSLFYTKHLKLSQGMSIFVVSSACALSILRVLRGHHTIAQVIVGAFFGSFVYFCFDFAIQRLELARFLDERILSLLDIQSRRVIFIVLSIILIYLFNLANSRWKHSFVKKKK